VGLFAGRLDTSNYLLKEAFQHQALPHLLISSFVSAITFPQGKADSVKTGNLLFAAANHTLLLNVQAFPSLLS